MNARIRRRIREREQRHRHQRTEAPDGNTVRLRAVRLTTGGQSSRDHTEENGPAGPGVEVRLGFAGIQGPVRTLRSSDSSLALIGLEPIESGLADRPAAAGRHDRAASAKGAGFYPRRPRLRRTSPTAVRIGLNKGIPQFRFSCTLHALRIFSRPAVTFFVALRVSSTIGA